MDIQTIQHGGYFYAVIDDFYSDEELTKIMSEIDRLKNELNFDEDTATATNFIGDKLKTGKGIWLDRVYSNNREESEILKHGRKLFNYEMVTYLASANVSYKHILKSTSDATLLNIYENGMEYKPHTDKSALTAIWFFKSGDMVGGDLFFPEPNTRVKFKHNRLVIFPGCMIHAAEPSLSCNGGYRVSIAKFLNYR
jgi:flagellin-like hook-associated protein FlgL